MDQLMTADSQNITIHMVASLDGYIASADGGISWMQPDLVYESGVELTEEQIASFLKSIDCYVMGSRTYAQAVELGWPYGDTPVVVLTSKSLTSGHNQVEFYSGDLHGLIQYLKPRFRNIWVVGGAQAASAFLRAELADRIVISVMPVLLGGGIPFFDRIEKTIRLRLADLTAFRDGMVEFTYDIIKG